MLTTNIEEGVWHFLFISVKGYLSARITPADKTLCYDLAACFLAVALTKILSDSWKIKKVFLLFA